MTDRGGAIVLLASSVAAALITYATVGPWCLVWIVSSLLLIWASR